MAQRERMLEQLFRVTLEFSGSLGIDSTRCQRAFAQAQRRVSRRPYRLHDAVDFQWMLKISELLAAWYDEPDFLNGHAEPRALPIRGVVSFATLVKRFLPGCSVEESANELIAQRLLERRTGGTLMPCHRNALFAQPNAMVLDRIPFLVQAFLSTTRHNLAQDGPKGRRCERQLTLDGLPEEIIDELNDRIKKQTQNYLKGILQWGRQRQRRPSQGKTGRLIVAVCVNVETDQPHRLAKRKP